MDDAAVSGLSQAPGVSGVRFHLVKSHSKGGTSFI